MEKFLEITKLTQTFAKVQHITTQGHQLKQEIEGYREKQRKSYLYYQLNRVFANHRKVLGRHLFTWLRKATENGDPLDHLQDFRF